MKSLKIQRLFFYYLVFNDKSEYDKILKTSWNVTPYKIVDSENFDIEDYISDKYSIAQLGVSKRTRRFKGKGMYTITSYLHMH